MYIHAKAAMPTALFLVIVFAALALVPTLVFGQADIGTPVAPPPAQGPLTSVGGESGILPLLRQILQWVAIIFWIAAVAFVLYAAFLYLTAAGNTEKTSKANKQLIFAIVAMIIGIIAYGLPGIVENFLSKT